MLKLLIEYITSIHIVVDAKEYIPWLMLTQVPHVSGHFLAALVLGQVLARVRYSRGHIKVLPAFIKPAQVLPFDQVQQAQCTMFYNF